MKTISDLGEYINEQGGELTDFLLGDGDVNGLEFIDRDGGGEGGSEDCYTVFKHDGQHYKVAYSYYSYCGYEWYDSDEIVKVTPREKTITVYE